MSINRVTVSGNLSRDGELRRTQGGMAILSLGLAVNDRRKNPQTGEWDDYTNWVDCTMFGKRAESLANSLVKGTKICVDGKLRWSQWQAKDGSKRSKLEVIVDEIEFMSRNQGNAQQQGRPPRIGGYQASTSNAGPVIDIEPESSVFDDDIPW